MSAGPVLLFDGVCNVCNFTVRFVLQHEADHAIQFAALQSELGKKLVGEHDITADSLVYVEEGGRVHLRSSAIVKVARHLGWPWKALAAIWIVPKPLRDLGYAIFAQYRYAIFGKRDACMVPTPEVRARFLEAPSAA